ncbi:MAG: InlB B-repeat-containing protein, partial [Oscillospiraceae bacterium]|nr:InlB B-repeat-containing protein [Oscillospiraceae bacterium]
GGTVEANAGNGGAGIGGGTLGSAVTINVTGGTVVANGDGHGAGIGGGTGDNFIPPGGGGNVTISGNAHVTANSGANNPYGIGPGANWEGGAPGQAGTLTVGPNATVVQNGVTTHRPVVLATVTFNSRGGSLVASQNIPTGSMATRPTPDPILASHNFGGWFTSEAIAAGTGGTPFNFSGTTITAPITLYARWTVVTTAPSPQNDRDRGGGIRTAITTVFAPAERWLTASDVAALPQAQDGSQRSAHNGRFGVRGAAWAGFGFAYSHDTTDSTGVQVRTFINNPRAMTGDVFVSAWVQGNDVNWTRSHFERFFSNDLRVVQFDHAGAFGQSVRAAARVDLTGMDAENLRFYNYDRAANTFRPIAAPNYRVDANGFLWFSVEQGGAVVISDGALARR